MVVFHKGSRIREKGKCDHQHRVEVINFEYTEGAPGLVLRKEKREMKRTLVKCPDETALMTPSCETS